MNHLTRPAALAALLFALLLGACSPDPGPPPLEGAAIGGPFTLTSHEGRRVTDRDFQDKYRIVYFGFASCPDVCPTDLQVIAGALRRFEGDSPARAERVQPVFVSVDPERDTPEVLARYVGAFHPRLIGLTGTPEQVAAATRAYSVYYSKTEPDAEGDYQMNHSAYAFLMSPEGAPLVMLPTDQGIDAVAAELDKWVR